MTGNRRLHRYHKFAVPLVETALRSLRHSCRSELTRQFRYLRTVIVTAAVYRGFSSKRRLAANLSFNLPAPGRRQTYTSYSTSQSPVFLVNSRLSLFIATLARSPGKPDHRRAPLLPKLQGQFAEFLNEGSHLRLRIFSSPTCVGLRY